jgi:hypothetical protein
LVRQFCQAPGFTGASSSASVQVAPKSMEISAARPSGRRPRHGRAHRSTTRSAPLAGKVTSDLTGIGAHDDHVLVRHIGARRHRVGRHAVGLPAHLLAVMDHVAHPDPRQPFLRARARPARHHQPQGAPFIGWIGPPFISKAIITSSSSAFSIGMPRDSGPCRDRPTGACRRPHGRYRPRVLHAGGLQHVLQAHAGPFRTGHGPGRPLVTARRRIEGRAAVAAAFDVQRSGDHLEFSRRSAMVRSSGYRRSRRWSASSLRHPSRAAGRCCG